MTPLRYKPPLESSESKHNTTANARVLASSGLGTFISPMRRSTRANPRYGHNWSCNVQLQIARARSQTVTSLKLPAANSSTSCLPCCSTSDAHVFSASTCNFSQAFRSSHR
eukprot:TRINITY_DN165_c0_g2_i4.p2 TRINITY_DN165_c0_g2~~TRINITY_DN165_c0_g2_i4.p2  ORF type:complete len:111 (+),score=4.43 TRINITY_DN165_c0_g2_i4:207-539(+)